MEVFCGHCRRSVSFAGQRPKFCGHCGQALATDLTAVQDGDATIPPAATAPAPPRREMEADVPSSVGGYKLLRALGGGAMGTVYEAEDAAGRRVAVKLIVPELTDSDQALERFRQEGRLASAIAHPRSVFVLAADEDAGRPYIVMELMPGSTLDDLVKQQGPLPPEQAIAKILDVIAGLEAAHELGLIHRDVKPSNCFLEADGRVKVGDFGLAKSAERDARLTRTGTFLGTPLFAAPEQIKCEVVDAQSDLYSVAATLYFLLTGQGPFETRDVMATLARIVSDDPPPMRGLRPQIPRALDKVVLRGLERDRKRRWRTLDDFHKALLPFLPAKPSLGGMGLRTVAYLLDAGIIIVLAAPIYLVWLNHFNDQLSWVICKEMTDMLVDLLYFGILEGVWGWSLGKRLLRLRVGTIAANRPPGVGRALARAAILCVVLNLSTYASEVLLLANGMDVGEFEAAAPQSRQAGRIMAAVGLVSFWGLILSVVAILAPMRPMNGFRGMHELGSGTRTYRLRWPRRQARQPLEIERFPQPVGKSEGLPERVGPFRVLGQVSQTEHEQMLLAEDPQLARRVWIWLRHVEGPALTEAQRTVSRGTRSRWVAGGINDSRRWDAFLDVDGAPLPAVVARGGCLSWAQTRPILEDLAEELAAACADGTLPARLTVDQVWIQPYGRVQLLVTDLGHEPSDNVQVRALHFLREVAVLALEGQQRPHTAPIVSMRARVPVHAELMLDRLLGVREPDQSVGDLQLDLEATRDRPTEVTPLRRLGHLALTIGFMNLPFPGLVLMFVLGFPMAETTQDLVSPLALVFIAGCAGSWVLWAVLFRGGLAFHRGGIALRRANGGKPSRLQCGLRAFLVWAPIALLLGFAHSVGKYWPQEGMLARGIWASALLLLIGYALLALRYPTRSLHDRLAGTYLVPD
jgi:eukaryotic-like serine/threonine-protein kinase